MDQTSGRGLRGPLASVNGPAARAPKRERAAARRGRAAREHACSGDGDSARWKSLLERPERPLEDDALPRYLHALGLAPAADGLVVESAGDGNINRVRRARAADGRSWIVKQARPRLERFPEYAAP